MKPTGASSDCSACWFTSARNPAQRGAAALVPPTDCWNPLSATMKMLSAVAPTSGRFLTLAEPPFVLISMPICHVGIGYFPLVPPLLAIPPPQFHVGIGYFPLVPPLLAIPPPQFQTVS